MTKIVFKFFEANVESAEVSLFLKKMEEVLRKFAGEAYHFRYYLEEPLNTTQPKSQKNGQESHNGSGYRTNKV